jgi:hypothetical protein
MGAEEPKDVEMSIPKEEYESDDETKEHTFTYMLVLPKQNDSVLVEYKLVISPDKTLASVFDDKNKRIRVKLIEKDHDHFIRELKLFIINNSPFTRHSILMAVAFGEVQIVIR